MDNLSEKELSAVQDILSEESLLIKKFQMLSEQSQDRAIKDHLMEISQKHQEHFNAIYSHLS